MSSVHGWDAGEPLAMAGILGDGSGSRLIRMALRLCVAEPVGVDVGVSAPTTALPRTTSWSLAEYDAFATRDLGALDPLILFLDGTDEQGRPALLCAWT